MAPSTRTSISGRNLSNADSSSPGPRKPRRSHRKSRNGCLECKRRHIRCDEGRPLCRNCEAGERECSFAISTAALPMQISKGQSEETQIQQSLSMTTRSARSRPSTVHNTAAISQSDNEQTISPLSDLARQGDLAERGAVDEQQFGRAIQADDACPSTIDIADRGMQNSSPASSVQLSIPDSAVVESYPGLPIITTLTPEGLFTSQHMILLHHAEKVPNFKSRDRNAVDIAVRYIVDAPYLMDEALAFTAFHMAHIYPGSGAHLYRLATELQNRALASFHRLTQTLPTDDRLTAVPRFLFAAILGRHVLAEVLTHCQSDFSFFIDHFVECIDLNRGIRTVTPPAREFLSDTEIGPFIDVILRASDKIVSPGHECEPLRGLMHRSDLNENGTQACLQAIDLLQRSFDLCQHLDEDDYPQAVSVFSVWLEPGFGEVLRKHQPEALVILAYWGVLLFRCRGFWAYESAGAGLIHAIAGHLGSFWEEVLLWPLSELKISCELDAVANPLNLQPLAM